MSQISGRGNTNGLGNVSKMDKITIKEERGNSVREHVISLKWNYSTQVC